jgi:hypothetical protein
VQYRVAVSPSDITVMTIKIRFDKGGMHHEQEYTLREDSLGSQMSKSQLLKREWSEDMAQNVRAHGCESR